MSVLATLRAVGRRVARSYVTVVVLGLIFGLVLAPVAFNLGTSTAQTVAVVPIEGTIDGQSAAGVTAALERARQDPSIEAVVLLSNSGGGGAASSEELYLQSKRTADKMPVVASVDASAASGAYYAIAPADRIYAKPASIVGSVGVLSTSPTQRIEPTDDVQASGPNKLSGGDSREFAYVLESLQQSFLRAVLEHRADDLTISETELASARVFSGAQAVNAGLVDEVGGRQRAVEAAARMADLDSYRVEVLRPTDRSPTFVSRSNYLASNATNRTLVSADYYFGNGTSPGPTFLMVPAWYLDTGTEATDAARTQTNTTTVETGGSAPSVSTVGVV